MLYFFGYISHNIQKGFGFRSFNIFLHTFILLKMFFRYSPLNLLYFIIERTRPRVFFRIAKFKPPFIYIPYVLTLFNSVRLGFR